MGHHKQAPLKAIDWNMIVLDTLHGLLRITDVIFGSLYEWARRSCDPADKTGLLKVSENTVRQKAALPVYLNIYLALYRWSPHSSKRCLDVQNRAFKYIVGRIVISQAQTSRCHHSGERAVLLFSKTSRSRISGLVLFRVTAVRMLIFHTGRESSKIYTQCTRKFLHPCRLSQSGSAPCKVMLAT